MAKIDIIKAGHKIPAYYAKAHSWQKAPGVIVIHEAIGLTRDIERICDRFASERYNALAIDLYSRGGKAECLLSTMRALLNGHGLAYEDIYTATSFLKEQKCCNKNVGVIGFCMGGGFALTLARSNHFKAASINYGKLPKDLDTILTGACPIVASYGKKDKIIQGASDLLKKTLDRLSIPNDVKLYEKAGHSFMSEYGNTFDVLGRFVGFGYHQESSEDAWDRTLAWFDTYLRAEITATESSPDALA